MKVLITLINVILFSRAQDTQIINVLYVNDDGNTIADKAVHAAAAYVQEHSELGINVNLTKVSGNRTESVKLLETLCQTFGNFVNSSKSFQLVLDTTMTGLSSETVKSFTAALGLPTISASFGQEQDLIKWRNIDEDQKKYLIQINPPTDIIPEIIRDIVIRQNITNAAILYDSVFVMEHKYKSLLQDIATRNVITAIDVTNQEQQILKLQDMNLVNFFILGRLETVTQVLKNASANGLFNAKFAWHVITPNSENIACECDDGRVLHVKPIEDSSFKERFESIQRSFNLDEPKIVSAFYFDFALQSFLAIGSLIGSDSWKESMTDFITCDDYDGSNTPQRTNLDLESALKKGTSELPTYGPFIYISNGKSGMQFSMELSIVSFRAARPTTTETVGTWDAGFNNNLTLSNDALMDKFTSAQIYRVVVFEQKPFLFKDSSHKKGFNGYCIDMMDKIAEELGFEYEVFLASDNMVGHMDDRGKWNGMVKDIMDKKADIGLGSISVMAERENVIDFTVPYYDLVGYMILVKSSDIKPSLFKFLTVLEDEVWLCVLAAYFITSFLLWIFDKYSPYSYQNNKEKYIDDEEKRIFNLKESLWFCMTSLTPQGGGEAPKNLSGRLVAATWWLFGFIIIASYTANLAAFLTVSRLETPIESLDDLSKQFKVKYAPVNGSFTMIYFQRMAGIEAKFYEIWKDMSLNDSLSEVERSKLAVWDYPVSDRFTKIWQSMQDVGLPTTLEEAVRKVSVSKSATDGFAFVGDSTDIKYAELLSCDLKAVGEEFSKKPYALAVQQGSPLKERLNTAILELTNIRFLEELRQKWWDDNPEKMNCPKPEDPSEGISMHNIGGVFIVILVGIGMACVILSIEYWFYKHERESKVLRVRGTSSTSNNPRGTGDRDIIKNINLKESMNLPSVMSNRMYPGGFH